MKTDSYLNIEQTRDYLADMGFNLSIRQVKRAAELDEKGRRKLPFFKDPIDGRLKIEKNVLREIYIRCQAHAENNARFGFHNRMENNATN